MSLKRILLVDDSANDRELTLMVLREHNLANEVIAVRDGVEALEFLRGHGPFADPHPEPPVVVLLDNKMPRMDGLTLLRIMKDDEALRRIPVVMLTSSAEERDLLDSYNLGVNAYVVKPVDFGAFCQAVREIGGFWAVLNQPPPHLRRED